MVLIFLCVPTRQSKKIKKIIILLFDSLELQQGRKKIALKCENKSRLNYLKVNKYNCLT
jgi:uncharacterized ubiquitin-like protein YukD